MEKNLLKKIAEFVSVNCYQTGKLISVPSAVYKQIETRDPSVANKEFQGFYVSPGFGVYQTISDFRMFCED